MVDTIWDLLANLAVLVALSNLSGFVGKRWGSQRLGAIFQGLLFGSSAVFGMLRPLVVGPGLFFDGRSVVLSLCALFFGVLAAGVAGTVAVACRILQGGVGASMGVLVIMTSIATGLAYRSWWKQKGAKSPAWRYFHLGLVVHLVMLLAMFTLPAGIGASTLKRVGIPVMLTYPLVTVLIGKILEGHFVRARMMESLREGEARYRSILQASPDGIAITDLEGRVTLASPAAIRMAGCGREEDMIGRPFTEFVVREDRDRAEAAFRLIARGEGAGLEEYRALLTRGKETHVEAHGELIRDADGNPSRVVLVVRDLTDRKKAEESLLQLQETWSQFMRHSPIYVYLKEVSPLASRVVQASDNFVDMVGIPGRDMVGKTMEELFPAEMAAKITADDWAVVSRWEILNQEETFGDRTYTTIKFPIRIGEANFLAGYTIDITERKRTLEALLDSESKLQLLLDSTAESIYGIDTNGACTFCNVACLRSLGYADARQLLGLNMHDQIHHSHRDGTAFPEDACRIFQAFREGRGTHVDDEVLWRADGTFFPAEYWSYPQRRDGRVVGAVVTFVDISDRRRLEGERRQLETQLQQAQKMESLGLLAGGVAHDMNNVLGAIMLLASTQMDAHPASTAEGRAFSTILKASERGGKMVRSLLGFARQSLAEEKEQDLNALVREAASLLERTTLERISLGMDLEPGLHPILGDANALAHAIMNLCLNAVDAMPERGTLTLRTRNIGEKWIELQVRDSGTGMPPEVLEKAMDPFFTTKAQGKGTGLGLSLVYSTVKAHHGHIELQSEVGRGTCVTIRFSAASPGNLEAQPILDARKDQATESLAVLVVDDDELVRTSLGSILEHLGHTVSTASSGEEAILLLKEGLALDLAILDMNMPGLGGAGTLPRLRALRPALPVIVATGRVDQVVLDLVSANPFVTLLSKPFTSDALRNHIGSILV